MKQTNNNSLIPDSIQHAIKQIQNDSVHGSTYITKKAIHIVEAYIEESEKVDDSFTETIQCILISILTAQPVMALPVSFSNHLLEYLDGIIKEDIDSKKESLHSFLHQFTHNLSNAERLICKYAQQYLHTISPLALYSSSGTIHKVINSLKKKNHSLHVYCAESRPKNEGTQLAQSLAKENSHIYLMTDATLFSKINDIKAVLMGADAITQEGISNKIGSYPLAILCQHHNIDIYCLTTSYKLLPSDYKLPDENQKKASDLITERTENINVINYYFDTTPLSLVTGIITEQGYFKPNEIIRQIKTKSIHPFLKTNVSKDK